MQNMLSERKVFEELSYYTLSHPDPFFIHQLAVDAFTAQTANEKTKPIAIIFALLGLYLVVEKGFSGKKVQEVHMQLAKYKRKWPNVLLPDKRGEITVFDVFTTPAGERRDEIIKKWCACVWNAYQESQQKIRNLAREELDIK